MKTLKDIDPKTWSKYVKHRKNSVPRYFQIAESPPLPFDFDKHETLFWFGKFTEVRVAYWEDGPFRFRAVFGWDEGDSDLDFLGEFTDKGSFPDTLKRLNAERNEYKRYKPQYSIHDRQKDLVRIGWAKGPAYEEAVRQVQEDMARAEEFGRSWSWNGLKVSVFDHHAQDEDDMLDETSLWRIESDADDSYLVYTALDLAAQIKPDTHRICKALGQGHLPNVL